MESVSVRLRPYGEKRDFDQSVGGGVDRDKLEASDFVFSKERKFPVVTPGDVQDAVSSWGRYKGPRSFEDFKRSLIALAKRKGDSFVTKLPKDWDVEGTKAVRTGLLESLRDKFEQFVTGLKSLMPEPEAPPLIGQKYMFTFKAQDGKDWMLSFTTNAFEDREGEIFTTKSIEEYVVRHEAEEKKGEFWFWHLPGSKYADIRWQAPVGRFLAEAGPFDDSEIGQAFKTFFNQHPDGHPEIAPMGWGMSHGYLYDPFDRKDKVYDWFDKKESTVLPLHVASNQYTTMEVLKMGMNEQQQAALKAIGGDALVAAVQEQGQARTKELEEAGIAYKSAGTVPDEKAAKATAVAKPAAPKKPEAEGEDEIAAVLNQIEDEALRAKIKGLLTKKYSAAPPAEKQEEEEEMPEKEKKEDGEKAITREEIATAIGGVVETLRMEQKAAADALKTELTELLAPVVGAVKGLSQTDEAKIAQKAAETPAQSLQDIINETVFSEKARIDGRTSLAQDGPKETEEPVRGLTGIPGLDWMLQNTEQPQVQA